MMICADLHVHSSASKRPSEWFLQKVGASESYTDIDSLYRKAKEQGMTYVTVTDHNTIEGALILVERYPEDTFISVEVTTYFPENNCKIHILVYDITPEQFEKIDRIRKNIYVLRRYLFSENLAHSVAHATYSVNKKVDIDILEKLILMFDVFEGLNGARNRYYNETWQEVLMNLTPATIDMLIKKHDISPLTRDPWHKGITGGSDDHAALFIAQTYTQVACSGTKESFVDCIKEKKTSCSGRCNDYKSFAFSIYKIFCDFSSRKNKNDQSTVMELVNTLLFSGNIENRFKNWMTRRRIKRGKEEKDKLMLRFFDDVHRWGSNGESMDVEERMDLIYRSMASLLDGYITILCESLVSDFGNGDAGKLFKNILSALPVMFLSFPFFSSLQHLFLDRDLIGRLRKNYIPENGRRKERILWFTDTIDDLNGVAINLKSYMKSSHEQEMGINFVVCLPGERAGLLPPGNINLPEIFSISPEFYDSYTLRIPSVLNSVEKIYRYCPEKIIISTPGPVGLLGLLMSKLMGIPCVSIYHTDFAYQAQYIFNDEGVALFINRYIRWFYSCASEIRVPTKEYISILAAQGYEESRMRVLRRGFQIDPPIFTEKERNRFFRKSGIPDGYTLMWAGRVSKDKRVSFLADIYKRVAENHNDLNLIICGDGPDLEELKLSLKEYDRVFFTGRIPTDRLLEYYSASDLFVFPSTTDTFGMVVAEAQACGLPVLVTDIGGPQEIILNRETGFVIPWDDIEQWISKVEEMITLKREYPEKMLDMAYRARTFVQENFSWSAALEDIISEREEDSNVDTESPSSLHKRIDGSQSAPKNGFNGKSSVLIRYIEDYDMVSGRRSSLSSAGLSSINERPAKDSASRFEELEVEADHGEYEPQSAVCA